MNSRILLFSGILFSCEKEELPDSFVNFSSEINFEATERYFSKLEVKTIELFDKGFYYSSGNIYFLELGFLENLLIHYS